jgi:sugar phosphate isomerase/epimerase
VSRAVLLSTGAMTRDPVQTDHGEILRHGPGLGVPGFELGIYSAWYGNLDGVISELRESGLSFPVVHAEKLIGAGLGSDDSEEADATLARLEVNCRAAAALDAKTLVLHLWERPTADREIERNLERLPTCVDTATAYGLALAVKTIPGDDGTPLANVQLALERDPRCRVTLDTEFLGFYGELEESISAEWLWSESAVRHVHIKDFDGRLRRGGKRRYLLPGEGRLDLQGFLNGLSERGYSGGLTLEATAIGDDGALDPERLSQMAAVVNQLAS